MGHFRLDTIARCWKITNERTGMSVNLPPCGLSVRFNDVHFMIYRDCA